MPTAARLHSSVERSVAIVLRNSVLYMTLHLDFFLDVDVRGMAAGVFDAGALAIDC